MTDEPLSVDVERVRAVLEQGRAPLRRRLEVLPGSPSDRAAVGLALGRAHAQVLDELLVALFPAALAATGARQSDLALVGVGGYGRGAVALGADLDVRLLARDLDVAEVVAQSLLYPLWDAGVSVGHQVVTVADLVKASRQDFPTATSLLDWRFVAGDRPLSDDLLTRVRAGIFSTSELAVFIDQLEVAVEVRQRRFGGSVYLLEPDVKNGPGALRDVDVARWAARARWNVGDFDELVRLGVLVPRQLEAVQEARETLWRIRNLLHDRAGRRSDRLSFDEQEAIAPRLGYEGAPHEAVERMMSDYYRAARTVNRFRDTILARARPALERRRPSARDLGMGILLFDQTVTVVDQELLTSEPVTALRLVAAAVDERAPIRPGIRNVLIACSGDAEWAQRLRGDEEAAALFVQLCTSHKRTRLKAGSVMRELHDLGLLLAMVPEFAPLVGRVHHDTYHVYTVDVHSVAAVDRLGEIVRGDLVIEEEEGGAWAGSLAMQLASEIARPQVLFLATLLHDVGKAIGRRDHSERGAELARTILARLPLEPGDVDDVCRLVAQHLTMYLMATRRDIDDLTTAAELAALVGDREGLRNLYLLTVADLSTTSPTSMTSWKARMLDELYVATASYLREGRQGRTQAAERRRQAAVALAGDDAEQVARFCDAMPDRYAMSTPPRAIVAHAAVVQEHLSAGELASVQLIQQEAHDEVQLCVVAADRPGLLAQIAATLAAARLQVHAAQIYSCPLTDREGRQHSLAVDVFWVQGGAGRPADARTSAPLVHKLQGDLRAVVSGGTSASELARSRRPVSRREREGPPVQSRVILDDRAAPGHTVVEVITRDRPGLLFALSHAIYRQGMSIAVAKIATEGARVVDVFYVSEPDGRKISSSERADALKRSLLELIEGMDD